MECVFCHRDVNVEDDAIGVICANCIQVLINSSQDKIKVAYQKAINEGFMDKAQAMENYLEEENTYVRETKINKQHFIRKSIVRMARPSLHQVRQKSAVV